MTRETKIGLFVGMGVIILLGILVSDYLSEAQRMQSPKFSDLYGDNGRLASNPLDSGTAAMQTGNREQPLAPPGEVRTNSTVSSQPIEIASTKTTSQGTTPLGAIIDRSPLGGAFEDVRDNERGVNPKDSEKIRQLEKEQKSNYGLVKPDNADRGVQTHVVEAGDTLSSIASRYYNSSSEWRRILKANEATLKSPTAMKIGMQLVIPAAAQPDSSVARSMIVETPTPKSKPESVVPTPSPSNQKPSVALREYKLRRGDTLGVVAEKFLGSSKEWQKVYDLNKNRIDDPHRLSEGLVVLVPSKS